MVSTVAPGLHSECGKKHLIYDEKVFLDETADPSKFEPEFKKEICAAITENGIYRVFHE
jgi:hypothetical protein